MDLDNENCSSDLLQFGDMEITSFGNFFDLNDFQCLDFEGFEDIEFKGFTSLELENLNIDL